MSRSRPLGALLVMAVTQALAGGRAHYGGTLKVVALANQSEKEPLLADTPIDATLLALSATPPCRLAEISRPSSNLIRLTFSSASSATSTAKVLEQVRTSPSPYAGLLAQVKAVSVSGNGVELQLLTANAEVPLCHPALSVPLGAFRASGTQLLADLRCVEGRPYLDAVTTTLADVRTAERLMTQRRAHVVLGSGGSDEATQLYATYLVAARPELAQAVDAVVERKDLARFFVRAPASPMFGLLPPVLGGAASSPPHPAPTLGKQDVTLLYDASIDDQKAVAEKLQVKLGALGARVALVGLPRAELRARWQTKQFDLLLLGVLLPPSPEVASEVVRRLSPSIPPVPLYVQGLAVAAAKEVQHLVRDAEGLPRLDDVFLSVD